MPGWNQGSGQNTIDQSYKLGWSDARRKIADGIEALAKKHPELPVEEVARRVRMGEMEL